MKRLFGIITLNLILAISLNAQAQAPADQLPERWAHVVWESQVARPATLTYKSPIPEAYNENFRVLDLANDNSPGAEGVVINAPWPGQPVEDQEEAVMELPEVVVVEAEVTPYDRVENGQDRVPDLIGWAGGIVVRQKPQVPYVAKKVVFNVDDAIILKRGPADTPIDPAQTEDTPTELQDLNQLDPSDELDTGFGNDITGTDGNPTLIEGGCSLNKRLQANSNLALSMLTASIGIVLWLRRKHV